MAFDLKEELQKLKNTALGQKALATMSDPELVWDAIGALGGGIGGYYLNKAFRDTAPSGFSSALATLVGATAGGAGAHWLQGKISADNGLTLREQYRLRANPAVQKELSLRMYLEDQKAQKKDRVKEGLMYSSILPVMEFGAQISKGRLPLPKALKYSIFDPKLNAQLQNAALAEQKLADVMINGTAEQKQAISALVAGPTVSKGVRHAAARKLIDPSVGKKSFGAYKTLLRSDVYRDAKGVLKVKPATFGRRLGAVGKAWGANLAFSAFVELIAKHIQEKRDKQELADMQAQINEMAKVL